MVVLCEAVDEQKRKASTSREQTDRAFFAKLAFIWAIAGDSPAFYGETVLWARRFVRDPVSTVISKIYRHERTVAASYASDCPLGSSYCRLEPSTFLFCFSPVFAQRIGSHFSLLSLLTVVFLAGLDANAFPIHSLVMASLRQTRSYCCFVTART
jgi:hypothetical protein